MARNEKLLPQNIEAEQGVLGSIILDVEMLPPVLDILRPDDFYRDAHRTIFEVMARLSRDGTPPDFLTICDELERNTTLEQVGGAGYITSLINGVPTSGNAEYYARIVERTSLCRQIIHACGQVSAVAYDDRATEALALAESLIFKLSRRQVAGDFEHISSILTTYLQHVDDVMAGKKALLGIPTGFIDLDDNTGGLQPGDLIIPAGRPSQGKTSFALGLAIHAVLKESKHVGMFSLEMSKQTLAQRILSMRTMINLRQFRRVWFEEEDWERIIPARDELSEGALYIADSTHCTVPAIRSKAIRLAKEHGLDMLIVDYLQLVRVPDEGGRRSRTREQLVAEVARDLKELALELGIPIVACAQLSRATEGRHDKVPNLSDLRESGEIENAADLVLGIHQPALNDGVLDEEHEHLHDVYFHILKQRNGPVGRISAKVRRECALFYDPKQEGNAASSTPA